MSRSLARVFLVMTVASTSFGEAITVGSKEYAVAEFRVNDYTSGRQRWPSMAVLPNDNFIVGWESWGQGAFGTECYGKVYSAEGRATGSEFLLNPYNTGGWEYGPAFAPLPDNGFTVSWGDSSSAVYMQRFDGQNSPVGADCLVCSHNVWPAASSAANGDFLVAWGRGSPTLGSIGARLYDSSAAPYGPEFQVNTDPLGLSDETSVAAVACAPDGNFTIAWHNATGDIRAQCFDSNGTRVGSELTVNSSTGGYRRRPSIRYSGTSKFIVAWQGAGDNDADGIYARRFAAGGSPLDNEEWLVNETTAGAQITANLAVGSSNEFVISWESGDNDGSGVFARLYDANGDAVDAEFQVNQYTTGSQQPPHFGGRNGAAIIGDMLLFTWYGEGDTDDEGIYITVLAPPTPGDANNTFAMCDFNEDGKIDGGDLAIWQQNYDPIGPGGMDGTASIPEPATLTLIALMIVPVLGRARRRG